MSCKLPTILSKMVLRTSPVASINVFLLAVLTAKWFPSLVCGARFDFIDAADNKRKLQWSKEANVSEDFDLALRLLLHGYTLRWVTYSLGGCKEGVSGRSMLMASGSFGWLILTLGV